MVLGTWVTKTVWVTHCLASALSKSIPTNLASSQAHGNCMRVSKRTLNVHQLWGAWEISFPQSAGRKPSAVWWRKANTICRLLPSPGTDRKTALGFQCATNFKKKKIKSSCPHFPHNNRSYCLMPRRRCWEQTSQKLCILLAHKLSWEMWTYVHCMWCIQCTLSILPSYFFFSISTWLSPSTFFKSYPPPFTTRLPT